MKSFIAVLTTLVVLSFSVLGQDITSRKHQMDSTKVEKPMSHKQHHDTTMTAKQVQQYTCPMHPEVIANKPGKCPKCGMTLVKVEAKKVKEAIADVYTCPMHTEVISDKPGKCPKCGMTLVKVKKAE
jgi:uncharacterized protein with PIN domain